MGLVAVSGFLQAFLGILHGVLLLKVLRLRRETCLLAWVCSTSCLLHIHL